LAHARQETDEKGMCMCGVMAWICPILKLSVLYNNGYYLGVKVPRLSWGIDDRESKSKENE
jgi:hypothetical protein